jgi:hypothetical protein
MGASDAKADDLEPADEGTPVCLYCLHPVGRLAHYCPHCGEAVGQLTPYIPFVNVRWQARIWGDMWRQVWSSRFSMSGRLFRVCLIVLFAPVLLLVLPFTFRSMIRRRRESEGLCPHCGYDLRASDERCPECGNPIRRDG